MPLVVVCGKPSSGKSAITDCFCRFIMTRKSQEIEVVSDNRNASFTRSIYRDSHKEREHRAILKSEVQRLLSENCLVICDSLNYIKGFRYELFCIAKLMQTTYCVLYCDANEDICLQLNLEKKKADRYEADDIMELAMRFEEPTATNRWDCPLFKVKIEIGNSARRRYDSNFEQCLCFFGINEKKLPLENMYLWLFEGRNLSANESTETASLMPADFLHTLDQITKEVVTSIMQQQRTALPGDTFIVPNCTLDDDKVRFTRQRSFAELSGLRRQFTSYMKVHPLNDTSKFASLFINYLNANP
ncbi:KTI12 protein [Loa loa]|uniref:Protein KTI12 homolog n=2 Tax=Loa loa TaxID=7209 RepID=A0A1S0UAV9_LOALO|nr:KTI12 protein [Loa loa]EFO27623.2 KTI12 protein [Loa loa]